jgi:eukaryotic-like serine/threonine-protein kinase
MKTQPIEWIGKILDDDFLIEAKIGQGGFALVFRATQRSLRRDVVVKILRTELVSEETVVARFRREPHLAAKLLHPNIATIYHTGVTREGIPFFVMELVKGLPLSTVLKRDHISPKRAAKILRQIAAALDSAHEQGITHRDLKPDNIMITSNSSGEDHVKLLDFGIAREEGGKSLTKTGELIGTPEYMSPEQSQGERITKTSDIYSMGIVAFELLTRRVPFSGPIVMILFQHISKAPPTLSDIVKKQFPKPIEDRIAKAIAKHPSHRYSTASEFAIALYRAIEAAGEAAIPIPEFVQKLAPDDTAQTTPDLSAALHMTEAAPSTLQISEELLYGQTIREVKQPEPTVHPQPTPNPQVLVNATPQQKPMPLVQPTSKTKKQPVEVPYDGEAFARYSAFLIMGLALIVLFALWYSKQ